MMDMIVIPLLCRKIAQPYKVVTKKETHFGDHFEILPGGNYFFCVHIWKLYILLRKW